MDKNIWIEKDDILYYNGRILPTQEFNAVVNLAGVMKDLATAEFCVSCVEKYSPLGYNLVNEVRWYAR